MTKYITAFALAVFLVVGCATKNNIVGRSLMTTDVTVDGAMQGWATWVVAKKATLEQDNQVRLAYTKYQIAFGQALELYKVYYKTNDKSALDQADALLTAASQAVLNTITTLKGLK